MSIHGHFHTISSEFVKRHTFTYLTRRQTLGILLLGTEVPVVHPLPTSCILLPVLGGIVHPWVGQKVLKCNDIKSYRLLVGRTS